MTNEFETRVLTKRTELTSIAQEWGQLWENSSSASPFQHPAWILAWLDAFRPEDIRVVEVRSRGTLVGLAPLLIYRRGEERVLAFMPGGVSDYLDLLAEPAQEKGIVHCVLNALDSIEHWTTLDLTDLSAHSPLQRTPLRALATPHDRCSALALPETKAELLQLFSKRQRANLRNARSRTERAGGGNIELASADTLPQFLDELFQLHTNRWSRAGGPGVLADDNVRAFHRSCAPELLAAGILRFYRLRLTNRTLAVVYTLMSHSTVFCYLQGFDPEFSHLSPGTQLMYSAIEDAVQLGMRKFDFLRGDEDYKRHWRSKAEPTYRIQLPRAAILQSTPAQTIAA